MFTAVLVAMLGMFSYDNAEFFSEVKKNNEQGYSWKYVGKQKANEYNYSLPVINEKTGEKFIYWEHQKPKED